MTDPGSSTVLQWAPVIAVGGVVVGALVGALAGWLTARLSARAALDRLKLELDHRRHLSHDDRHQARLEATYEDLLRFLTEHASHMHRVMNAALRGAEDPPSTATEGFSTMAARVEVFASDEVLRLFDEYVDFTKDRLSSAADLWTAQRSGATVTPAVLAKWQEFDEQRLDHVTPIITAVRLELGTAGPRGANG